MISFRVWVTEQWFNHTEEVLCYTRKTVDYDVKEYFQRYKWWLKREYKYQIKK